MADKIILHPLVVVNIADHFTRSAIQNGQDKAIGIILGSINKEILHIVDCIEVSFEQSKDEVKLAFHDFEEDFKLHKEAYPKNEVIGWYCTGARPEEVHSNAFRSISSWHESRKGNRITKEFLFLLMNPNAKMSDDALPITLYNEKMDPRKYRIQSDTAETVAVVHCAQESVEQKKGSKLIHHYENVHRGLKMMRDRLKVLHDYVQACKKKKIRPNIKILRQIKGVCNRLPTMQTSQFKSEFKGEYNDALLVSYLSSVTENSTSMGAIVQNFNSIYGNQSRSFMRYDE